MGPAAARERDWRRSSYRWETCTLGPLLRAEAARRGAVAMGLKGRRKDGFQRNCRERTRQDCSRD